MNEADANDNQAAKRLRVSFEFFPPKPAMEKRRCGRR